MNASIAILALLLALRVALYAAAGLAIAGGNPQHRVACEFFHTNWTGRGGTTSSSTYNV